MRLNLNRSLPLLALLLLAGCPHDLTRRMPDGAFADAVGDLGDGGLADLPPCFPTDSGLEVCDGKDNDCDGLVDEGFDLQTDSNNCGACGTVCVADNATSKCLGGICAVDACSQDSGGNSTHWDIDGKYGNGCEYPCSITAGGHEVCDGKDNDCDRGVDEDCSNLTLLYRFGDPKTEQNWPVLHDLAAGKVTGVAQGNVILDKTGGVKADGGDGMAASMDGINDRLAVTSLKPQSVINCDISYGWSGSGTTKAELVASPKKEGSGAIKVPGKTDGDGVVAIYENGPRDLSQWITPKNELSGFLSFWVYIDDASRSQLERVVIGKGKNVGRASWSSVPKYVLGPKKGAFLSGWNLVSLPFAQAFYVNPSLTVWKNVSWLEISTNRKNDSASSNYFIFDDFRVDKNLSQRFTRFTFMAWVKPTQIKAETFVVHKKGDQPAMGIDDQKRWWFSLGGTVDISVSALAVAGKWTHLAMTYDGSLLTAYVNGAKVGSRPGGFIPGERLWFGGNGAPDGYFKGHLDEVALYSRALTEAELERYYSLFKP